MRTHLFALTAGLATTASAFDCHGPYFSFYNRQAPQAMSYQRLDPALFPGTESPHLHSFDGGNGLAASMGYETTQESTCTTARIKPDKSLYWRPTLFWNGNNTGFYRVPEKFLKVYYKFGDAGNVRANVTEFPENFSMIVGNPYQRKEESDNPGGIKWACLGDNYSRIDASGFPKGFTSCKEGLTSEVTFPSCWNGKDLDPKKPSAHMAWPTASGTGLDACPDGFKVARFPTIFIEFWWDVSAFDGQYSADSVPWVLSNGDPTGYGFHADFLNGWEKGVLAKATGEGTYCDCGCGCGNDEMKKCFGADNVNEEGKGTDFDSCSAQTIYGGDDSSPLEKLPGCNPIQSGPADATQATGEGCDATPAPGSGSTASASAVPSVTGNSESSQPTSSKAPSSNAASSAEAEKVETDAPFPSLSISLGNKQEGNQPGDNYEIATSATESKVIEAPSSKLASVTDLPSLSLATTASPAESSAPPAGGEGDCKAPVYITITPTVYVTAGSENATSCDLGTVTATVTNTATVTVSAGGYKHKRHGLLHHKH